MSRQEPGPTMSARIRSRDQWISRYSGESKPTLRVYKFIIVMAFPKKTRLKFILRTLRMSERILIVFSFKNKLFSCICVLGRQSMVFEVSSNLIPKLNSWNSRVIETCEFKTGCWTLQVHYCIELLEENTIRIHSEGTTQVRMNFNHVFFQQ